MSNRSAVTFSPLGFSAHAPSRSIPPPSTPSLATIPPIHLLPTEILEMIFLWIHEAVPWNEKRALLWCALVCRRWVDPGLRHLYQCVTVRNEWDAFRFAQSDGRRRYPISRLSLDSLKYERDVWICVEGCFHIRSVQVAVIAGPAFFVEWLFLPSLKGLQQLHFQTPENRPLPPMIPVFRFQPTPLLLYLPKLEIVTFDSRSFSRIDRDTLFSLLWVTQVPAVAVELHLRSYAGGIISYRETERLVAAGISVTELELPNCKLGTLEEATTVLIAHILLMRAPNLVSLKIRFEWAIPDYQGREEELEHLKQYRLQATAFISMILSLTPNSLKELIIDPGDYPFEVDNLGLENWVVDRNMESLERIEVGFDREEYVRQVDASHKLIEFFEERGISFEYTEPNIDVQSCLPQKQNPLRVFPRSIRKKPVLLYQFRC